MIDPRRVEITAVRAEITAVREDLLRLVFRLPMKSWPAELRPELRQRLAEMRRRLLQA